MAFGKKPRHGGAGTQRARCSGHSTGNFKSIINHMEMNGTDLVLRESSHGAGFVYPYFQLSLTVTP